MNAINVITPYQENGIWKFDDQLRGLKAEPFVGTTNDILSDMINQSIYVNPYEEVSIFFSDTDFPGTEYVLTADHKDVNGMWYRWGNTGDESQRGWLCPAALKYFEDYPEKIFIKLYTKSSI